MTFTILSAKRKNAERRRLVLLGRTTFLAVLLLAGCARDAVDEAAWQASRVGTAFGEGHQGRGTAGLEAGTRITERFYFVAKYQATLEQRRVAETAARPLAARLVSEARKPGRKPAPNYIAVRTRPDSRAKTRISVVIWDIRSAQIVGNSVYDLNDQPPLHTMLRFETYSAQYVGAVLSGM